MKKIWTRIQTNFILKMTLTACFLLLLPGVIILIMTYQINYRSLSRQLLTFNQQMMEIVGEEWQESMKQITDISLTLYDADPIVLKALRSRSSYEIEQQEQIAAELSAMLSGNNSLMGIDITGNNGEVIREYRFISQSRWQTYAETEEFDEGFQVYLLDGKPYFGVYKSILIDYPAENELATVKIYFSYDEWDNQAQNLDGNMDGHKVVLLGENGKLLYQHGEQENIAEGLESSSHMIYEGKLEDTVGYYLVRKLTVYQETYRLIHFFPKTEITESIRRIIAPLLFFDIFLMGCMIAYLIVVYGKLLHPIKRIASNMKKVQEGIYRYTAKSHSLDEIGKMDRQYEEMVHYIDYLVNQKMRHEIEMVRTKLKVLQAQINPHFLNNMLQMISTQALCEDAEETDKMICSLARLLQYNMEVDREVVCLEEEFHNIEHYLKLQNERYNGKIIANIDHSEICKQIRVPKMILQPLVENAIKYSHLKDGMECHLNVWAKEERNHICVIVADDGYGISEEHRQQILKQYEKNELISKDGHGIGLLNVLLRLRIFFQHNFAWEIVSNQQGCTIMLILPLSTNGIDEIEDETVTKNV